MCHSLQRFCKVNHQELEELLTEILILTRSIATIFRHLSEQTTKQYKPRFERASDPPEVQTVYLSYENLKCYWDSSLVSDVHYDLLTFRFHSIHSHNSATELFKDHAMQSRRYTEHLCRPARPTVTKWTSLWLLSFHAFPQLITQILGYTININKCFSSDPLKFITAPPSNAVLHQKKS